MSTSKQAPSDAFTSFLAMFFGGAAEPVSPQEFVGRHPECLDVIGAGIKAGEFTRAIIEQHAPAQFRAGGAASDPATVLQLFQVLGQIAEQYELKSFPPELEGPEETDDTQSTDDQDAEETEIPKSLSELLTKYETPAAALAALQQAREAAGGYKPLAEKIGGGLTHRSLEGWAYHLKKMTSGEKKTSGKRGKATPRRTPDTSGQGLSKVGRVQAVIPNRAAAEKLLRAHGSVGKVCKALNLKGITEKDVRNLMTKLKVPVAKITGR